MVLAIVDDSNARHLQRWKSSLNVFALSFQPGWQDQPLSQVFHIFVTIEARTIRRQLEKDSTRFFIVHRLEPKPIDLRGGAQPGVRNSLSQGHLLLRIL